MMGMKTIWVVNHSGHNISAATRDYRPESVECLTEGDVKVDEVDRIKYNMATMMRNKGFNPQTDAILLCGNIVLNAICMAVIFGYFKAPNVTILIWDRGRKAYFSKLLDTGGIDRPKV